MGNSPSGDGKLKRGQNHLASSFYANGFKTEITAKLAGEKALRELLDGIAREQNHV